MQTINKATNKTPLLPVEPENSWDHPYSPVPWASNFKIEKDGDHHSEVIEAKSCQYYEGYVTEYDPSSNALAMYNNTHADLTKPFVRPATGALSTATGIPLGLLAVRPEELAAGVIRHAIGWNIVSGTGNGASNGPCVSPAGKVRCTDGNSYDGPASDTPMPYGSHARLKASFDTSGFSREAKIVAQAMQKYGLYVYDSGCCNVIILADDVHGEPRGRGRTPKPPGDHAGRFRNRGTTVKRFINGYNAAVWYERYTRGSWPGIWSENAHGTRRCLLEHRTPRRWPGYTNGTWVAISCNSSDWRTCARYRSSRRGARLEYRR